MSFFGTLGNIGKALVKPAVAVAGAALAPVTGGLSAVGAGAILGGSAIASSSSSAQVDGATPPIAPAAPAPTATGSIGSGLLDGLNYALHGIGSALTGQSHVQIDTHSQIGGTYDPNNPNNSSSSFPSWLLPAGIGVGVLALMMSNKGGRR